MDISNLADAVLGDWRNDGGAGANQSRDARFAGALSFAKERVEHEKHARGDRQTGQCREWRTNPRRPGEFNFGKNHTEAAERRDKRGDGGRAEWRHARHARMLEAGFGVAARPDVGVGIMAAAKDITDHSTGDGEDKSHPEADEIDEEGIHKVARSQRQFSSRRSDEQAKWDYKFGRRLEAQCWQLP